MGILTTILPESGPYLLGTPASFTDIDENGEEKVIPYIKHRGYGDIATLERDAEQLSDTGLDVYFALGAVEEVRRKKVRIKDNIKALRAFWLDIDVKDKEGNYSTKEEAAKALRGFVAANGLPKPTVVDSGHGYHVYWPMSRDIGRDQWEHYAAILKAAVEHYGLLADPSRTADCASILRVPGTLNYKDSPVMVSLAMTGPVSEPEALMASIAACQYNEAAVRSSIRSQVPLELAGERPSNMDNAANINEEAAGGTEQDYLESNPKRVVSRCQQLLWQAQNPNEVEEPQWYDMIGCLRHAKDGNAAVHAMSQGYRGYSRKETDTKIEQHIEGGYGPTLCETFEAHRPNGCAGCPFAGKISTPLVLGREREEADAPQVQAEAPGVQAAPLPKPPFPFKRVKNPETGESSVAYVDLGEEVETEVVIYEHDLYPRGIIYDERENKYVVELERYLPQDGWEVFPVPLGKFYDRRSLATTLGDIGVMPDLSKVEMLVQYMIGYIRELQKATRAATIYAQLGWREDDKFVLGDRILIASEGRTEKINPHRNIVNTLSWQEPRGDIERWREVVSMYERPGLEAFQFGIGVAWAAPLFRFTNFNGMIMSMVGEKGCGKSSIMHVVNSVWGHKTHAWADIEHDTVKAFYNKIGVLKNLPVCYDEVTNLDEESLSDLCYSVSKGQGRQRLHQDGSARENFGSWQTMMLTSSNASLHSRLSLAKADASAEAVRVFEYYLPNNAIPKQEADEKLDLLNENFGLAGELYMHEVMKDISAVKERIKYWTRYMEQNAKVTSGERFWAAGPACILAGYEIANRLGLANVDTEQLAGFATQCIIRMREAVKDDTKSPVSTLGDYLNGNLRKMLVLNDEPKDGTIALVAQEPRDELRIRYEVWNGLAYIDRSHFRQYCAKNMVDVTRLKRELLNSGVMLRETRTVLGKGTAWKTAQTWCWVIDMTHHQMGNVSGAVQSSGAKNAAEVATEAVTKAQQGGGD